jgi:hypothetical protein
MENQTQYCMGGVAQVLRRLPETVKQALLALAADRADSRAKAQAALLPAFPPAPAIPAVPPQSQPAAVRLAVGGSKPQDTRYTRKPTECSECGLELDPSFFSKHQLSRSLAKRRCRTCIAASSGRQLKAVGDPEKAKLSSLVNSEPESDADEDDDDNAEPSDHINDKSQQDESSLTPFGALSTPVHGDTSTSAGALFDGECWWLRFECLQVIINAPYRFAARISSQTFFYTALISAVASQELRYRRAQWQLQPLLRAQTTARRGMAPPKRDRGSESGGTKRGEPSTQKRRVQKSSYVGVCPASTSATKWAASLSGKYLGQFETEIEAAEAYDVLARARRGVGAHAPHIKRSNGQCWKLNFPTVAEIATAEIETDEAEENATAAAVIRAVSPK